MKLLIIYKTFNKIVDVTDKSDIEAAVEKTFKDEIGNRPFRIQYYEKDFEDFVDLAFAEVKDRGKMRLIVEDCLDTGQSSLDEPPAKIPRTAILAEAQRVDQVIENSTVNAVAGNQSLHFHSIGKTNNQEINCEELIANVNSNTRKTTSHSILTDFKHEGLHESGCVVYPQMVEIDVNNYYKGRHGLLYTKNTSDSAASQNKIYRNQLTEEIGFYRQQHGNKVIEIKDFVESIWKRQDLDPDYVEEITAIVASAGSGKTTLTRRIARKALENMTTDNENVNTFRDRQKHAMVHYIELKDINEDVRIKPSEFLFHGIVTQSEQEQVYRWLVKNQSDVILIFDGLDQTTWDFNVESLIKIRNYEDASASTIMYNILARNILRHVKIFIASREFKVSELPLKARPERIIALNGLTHKDANRLFISLLGEIGINLWERIEAMSPRLLQLVCVPVFLILTAIVMGRDPSRDPPTTVTELYNRIVLNLDSVENIRNERILAIIKNLKEMAFRGTQEGTVIFKDTDLNRYGVSAREVEDLMLKIPGNKLVSSRLLQKDFNFFFCHQSMQEYLAASFVAEMDIDDFSDFNEKHLHGKRWSVVRRFVAGIVFATNELHNVSDRTRKQKIFTWSIRSQLLDSRNITMDLFTVIYESNNNGLMNQLSEIDLSHMQLRRDEVHVAGTLIARGRSLRSCNLTECHINAGDMEIIGKYLKARINVLELTTKYMPTLKLTRGKDVITISGEGIFGYFSFAGRTLQFLWFQNIYRFSIAKFFNRLFKPEFITIHVPCHDLHQIEIPVGALSVICYEDKNIDWSSIQRYVQRYGAVGLHLDIFADGKATIEEYNDVLKHGNGISALGVCVNIIWSFYVRNIDDVRSVLKVCQQRNIESVRCWIDWLYRPSFDDISSLLKHSKKLTLLYWGKDDLFKGDDLDKIQTTCQVLGTQLTVLSDSFRHVEWPIVISFRPESTTLDEYHQCIEPTGYVPSGGCGFSKLLSRSISVNQGDGQKEVSEVVGDEPGFSLQLKGDVSYDISYVKLIKIVNNSTAEKTTIRILDYFKDKRLYEPGFVVFPQIITVDFNEHHLRHEISIDLDRTRGTDDNGFYHQRRYPDKAIKIEDFMATIWQKEESELLTSVDITAIVASAGSGKTTLLRKIAQEALSTSSAKNNKLPKMVHYVELKDIVENKPIKTSEFLFGGVYKSETEKDQAYEWLVGNQTEAILLFDGFDQTEWVSDDHSIRRMRKDERARPSTIMHNILTRNILRHVKIFIASRDFKVSELPATARPKNIIALNGFTLQDARRLFISLLAEKGEKRWEILETMSPGLLQPISVPVFLILTAIVMGTDPNKDPPTTVTELYNGIVSRLQSVETIRNRKDIVFIINKLKWMAFRFINEDMIIDETVLKECNVSAAEVLDLMSKIPDPSDPKQANFVFIFCHRSVMEFLAASFVAEMAFDEFSDFYREHLQEYKWCRVRPFVAGIIYSKSSDKLHKDREKKKELLSRLIHLQIERKGVNALMEVYDTIYETNDDDLMRRFSAVDVSGFRLSRHEKKAIGSWIAKSVGLKYLSLCSCNVDADGLATIAKYMKRGNKVDYVDLRENCFSANALGSFLGLRGNEINCLDWKIVRLMQTHSESTLSTELVMSRHIEWTKEGHFIKINDEENKFEGRFHVQESKLIFDKGCWLSHLIFCSRIFAPKLIKVHDRLIYVPVDDLRELLGTEIEKNIINNILLDCAEEKIIDWLWIEDFVVKYQVELLEIVVNSMTSLEEFGNILKNENQLSRLGVRVNIHCMFRVQKADDVRRMLDACQQKKIEPVRCVVKCDLSLDDILTLVDNSKKLTLIYINDRHFLKGEESEKFQ